MLRIHESRTHITAASLMSHLINFLTAFYKIIFNQTPDTGRVTNKLDITMRSQRSPTWKIISGLFSTNSECASVWQRACCCCWCCAGLCDLSKCVTRRSQGRSCWLINVCMGFESVIMVCRILLTELCQNLQEKGDL